MIETFRKKYLSAWLVGAVLVFILIGFIFQDSRRGASANSGVATKVLRINDDTYTLSDYQKKGELALQVATQLGQNDFITKLINNSTNPTESFFIHRIILKKKASELGITPSDNDINNYIRNSPAFQDPSTHQFLPETYTNYVQNRLGAFGMNESNLRDLIADILRLQQIESIISSGLQVNPTLISKSLALQHQWISGNVATLNTQSIRQEIKITDEEVKQYWDTLRDSFKTPLKRKFEYIITATSELPPEEKDPKTIETHRSTKKSLDQKMNTFVTELMKQKGNSFNEIAQQQGLTVQKTDWISTQNQPTGDLARTTENQITVFQNLMTQKVTSDPQSKISDAIPLSNNSGWIIARITEEQTPRVETFEEAREKAKTQWISEKSIKTITTRAEDLQKNCTAALKTGKSFDTFAKEQNLTNKPFTEISASMPMTAPLPPNLFQLTSLTQPGQLTDKPIITENSISLVWVSKRETPKQQNPEEITTLTTTLSENLKIQALLAWFEQQVQSSKIERLVNLSNSQ